VQTNHQHVLARLQQLGRAMHAWRQCKLVRLGLTEAPRRARMPVAQEDSVVATRMPARGKDRNATLC